MTTPEIPLGANLPPRYRDQLRPQLLRIVDQAKPTRLDNIDLGEVLRPPTNRENVVGYVNDFYSPENLDIMDTQIRDRLAEVAPDGVVHDRDVVVSFYLRALNDIRIIDAIRPPGTGKSGRQRGQQPTGPLPATSALSSLTLERIGLYLGTKYADALSASGNQLINTLYLRTEDMKKDTHRQIQRFLAPYSSILNDNLSYALSIKQACDEMAEEQAESTTQLHESNNRLYGLIEQYRSYGLKSASVPTFREDATIKRWLVDDPLDDPDDSLPDAIRRMKGYMPPLIARFSGTDGRFRSTRVTSETEKGTDNTPIKLYRSFQEALEPGSRLRMLLGLSEQGELVSANGMPLEEILQHTGTNTAGFQALRAEILCQYSDLIAPATIVAAARREQAARPQDEQSGTTDETQRKPSMLPLVLARIKEIENPEINIEEEFTRELEETAVRSTTQQTTTYGHDVIGHRRKLQPDQQASPRARELAETAGVILAESGETFVKAHYSPLGAPRDPHARGHEGVQRRPSNPRTENER